jgi:hypothetical protein
MKTLYIFLMYILLAQVIFPAAQLENELSIEEDLNKDQKSVMHGPEIGLEFSGILYQEPELMEEFGPMLGVCMNKSYYPIENLNIRLENKLAMALITYDGQTQAGDPLKIKGIKDILIMSRITIGRPFFIAGRRGKTKGAEQEHYTYATPYTGIGYRFLLDDLSINDAGYRRESNYLYSPFGVELSTALLRTGLAYDEKSIRLEYLHLLTGLQKSKLSDLDPGLGDIENKQKHGFGIRGVAKNTFYRENVTIGLKVSFTMWKIQNSIMADVIYLGSIIGTAIEPSNESYELGIGMYFMM